MLGLVDATAGGGLVALGTGVTVCAGTGVAISRETVSRGRLLKYHAAIPATAIRKTRIEIGITREGLDAVPGGGDWDTGAAGVSFGSMTR